jgi:hypothetical protein
MKVTSQITVDLLRPNVATLVYAKQADQQSRFISATLLEGSQPWTPPAGALAAVRYRKPDGTIGWYDTTENKAKAVTMSGNVAAIQLAAQALAVSGDVYIELEFYTQSAEKLSSFAWKLAVEASAVSDGEIESSDYFNVLAETLAEIVKALPNIQNADKYAQAAANSATQAANSETAAKASEQAAATSKTQAATSASNSAAAAQNSSKSAAAAKASADAATASQRLAATNAQAANDAAASATVAAANAEGAAQDSEAWAVGTRNGQAVPASDETHNNNSKYWAQQAAAAAGGGVITFNGRSGSVLPAAGDYTADMVGAPTTEEFAALKTTVDGKQPATNDLEAETNLADGDFVPFYDTSSSASRKTLWSNIVAKIRTALFGSANGFLKANGSGVVSAVSTIPVASGGTGATTAAAARANLGALSSANGAVTYGNLSVSARCGLAISASAGKNLENSDAGNTYYAGWTSTGSVKTWTLNAELSAAISNGFAVAFTELWPSDKTRISISGVRLLHRGEGTLLGKSQSAVLGLVERCNMIALQKMSTDATNGDVWLITGDVEVIS